jgi:hypothetical protein
LGHQNKNRPFGLYKPPGFEVSGPPSRHKPSPFNGGPPQQPIQNLRPNFGPPDSSNFQPSYGPDVGQEFGPRRPPNNEGMKNLQAFIYLHLIFDILYLILMLFLL